MTHLIIMCSVPNYPAPCHKPRISSEDLYLCSLRSDSKLCKTELFPLTTSINCVHYSVKYAIWCLAHPKYAIRVCSIQGVPRKGSHFKIRVTQEIFSLEIQFINAINNGSACSVLFLRTTGLFPARRKILEHETWSISKNFKSCASLTFEQAQAKATD